MEPHVIRPEKEYQAIMFIIWAFVMAIGVISLMFFLVFIPDTAGKVVFGIVLVVFVFTMILIALWIPAFYKTLVYSINNEVVKMSMGVLWKKLITVPYGKITNVDITQGPLQRKYNLGTIHIQTAGAGGAQGAQAELRLKGIRDLDGLKDSIMEKVIRLNSAQPEQNEPDRNNKDVLMNILTELQSIRRALEQS